MAKAKGKGRKREYEHFVFAIKTWEPDYSFSINQGADSPYSYSEYVEIKLETECIEPTKCAGAATHFILSSRRHCFPNEAKLSLPKKRERWIGELRLGPKVGSYYGGIPHESVAAIISALSSQRLGCIVLRGDPLSHGSSWCQSIDLLPRWE